MSPQDGNGGKPVAGRRITSADVAREARVSRATVSYVLNDDPRQRISSETSERVLRAAQQLGYQPFGPARLLRGGQSRLILMTSTIEDGLSPVGASIVEQLGHELATVGLQLIWQLGAAGTSLPHLDLTPRVMLSSALHQYAEPSGYVRGTLVPVLPAFPGLTGFLGGAAVAQVEYLAERLHSRLVYAAPSQPNMKPYSDIRWQALRRACRRLHLPAPTCIVVRPDRGGSAAQLLELMSQSNPPTAACAYNDTVASVILAAALDLGLDVPAQLAVIGVDAQPWGEMLSPGLTTVQADLDEFISRMAANIARVAEGGATTRVVLPRHSQVVPRQSG